MCPSCAAGIPLVLLSHTRSLITHIFHVYADFGATELEQFETIPRSQFVPEGQPVLLECQVSAAQDVIFKYSWTRNGNKAGKTRATPPTQLHVFVLVRGFFPASIRATTPQIIMPSFLSVSRIHNCAPKDCRGVHANGFVYPGVPTSDGFRNLCLHRHGFTDGRSTINACGLFERAE